MAITDKITAIANAIRKKTGINDLITLDQMPRLIESIKTESSNVEYSGGNIGWRVVNVPELLNDSYALTTESTIGRYQSYSIDATSDYCLSNFNSMLNFESYASNYVVINKSVTEG